MSDLVFVKDLSELKNFSKRLLESLNNNDGKQAKVIALSGDLGAGKTTLVQQLAKELGILEVVTSPTFTIMKIYPVNNSDIFKRLVHIDAYRIDSLEELRPLRFEEILADKDNLVCIEWAERIKPTLPSNTLYLDIKITEDEERKIAIFRA